MTIKELDPELLSIIVRFHDIRQLDLLKDALASLTSQAYRPIEVWVVTQALRPEDIREIEALVASLGGEGSIHVSNVGIPPGTDGRTTLLNHGLNLVTGRFLAFLDYDDVIYPEGYSRLVTALRRGVAAVAVGGCKVVFRRWVDGSWKSEDRGNPFAWGKTRLDLFRDNFIPFHSIVVDRSKVDAAELHFDESLVRCEDYELLLRLAARYEFDFSNHISPVCEYRMREGGTTVVRAEPGSHESSNIEKWDEANFALKKRKRELAVLATGGEISDLVTELAELRAHQRPLSRRLADAILRRVFGRKL